MKEDVGSFVGVKEANCICCSGVEKIDDTSFDLVNESKSIRNDGGSSGGTSGYDVVDVGSIVGVAVAVGWSVVAGCVAVAIGVGWVGVTSVAFSSLHPVINSASMAIMRRPCIQSLLLKFIIINLSFRFN